MRRQLPFLLVILALAAACANEQPPKPAPAPPAPPAPVPTARVETKSGENAKSSRLSRRKNRVAGAGAAKVNGYPILTAEVNDLANVYCQQTPGGCPDEAALRRMKKAALDFLIDLELVTQTALDRGVVASDEEIQQRIEAMIAEMGGVDQYQELLTKGGNTEAEAREDVADEVCRSKLLRQVREEAEKEGRDPRTSQQDFIVSLRSAGQITRYEEY